MELPQKIKKEVPYDPAIPLLGIYPKELKSGSSRGICTPMFTAALFTIAKIRKQSKYPSMNEWIKKMWSIWTITYIIHLSYNINVLYYVLYLICYILYILLHII